MPALPRKPRLSLLSLPLAEIAIGMTALLVLTHG
jgi:hypothetical protein